MNRSPEFDAALLEYLPSMRRQAKHIARERCEDLLQETIVNMLADADKCRIETFRTWAQIVMRRTASNYLRAARQQKRSAYLVDIDTIEIGVSAPQDASTDLSKAVATLGSIKYGDIVLRRASGELLREIAAERGVKKEAVRQLEAKARARFLKAAA